jgi:hypothetical protein
MAFTRTVLILSKSTYLERKSDPPDYDEATLPLVPLRRLASPSCLVQASGQLAPQLSADWGIGNDVPRDLASSELALLCPLQRAP